MAAESARKLTLRDFFRVHTRVSRRTRNSYDDGNSVKTSLSTRVAASFRSLAKKKRRDCVRNELQHQKKSPSSNLSSEISRLGVQPHIISEVENTEVEECGDVITSCTSVKYPGRLQEAFTQSIPRSMPTKINSARSNKVTRKKPVRKDTNSSRLSTIRRQVEDSPISPPRKTHVKTEKDNKDISESTDETGRSASLEKKSLDRSNERRRSRSRGRAPTTTTRSASRSTYRSASKNRSRSIGRKPLVKAQSQSFLDGSPKNSTNTRTDKVRRTATSQHNQLSTSLRNIYSNGTSTKPSSSSPKSRLRSSNSGVSLGVAASARKTTTLERTHRQRSPNPKKLEYSSSSISLLSRQGPLPVIEQKPRPNMAAFDDIRKSLQMRSKSATNLSGSQQPSLSVSDSVERVRALIRTFETETSPLETNEAMSSPKSTKLSREVESPSCYAFQLSPTKPAKLLESTSNKSPKQTRRSRDVTSGNSYSSLQPSPRKDSRKQESTFVKSPKSTRKSRAVFSAKSDPALRTSSSTRELKLGDASASIVKSPRPMRQIRGTTSSTPKRELQSPGAVMNTSEKPTRALNSPSKRSDCKTVADTGICCGSDLGFIGGNQLDGSMDASSKRINISNATSQAKRRSTEGKTRKSSGNRALRQPERVCQPPSTRLKNALASGEKSEPSEAAPKVIMDLPTEIFSSGISKKDSSENENDERLFSSLSQSNSYHTTPNAERDFEELNLSMSSLPKNFLQQMHLEDQKTAASVIAAIARNTRQRLY